jgi:hypothetical protein
VVTCPHCHRPLSRSETLVPNRIVQGCKPCGVWHVEGIDQWVQSGYNLGGRLLATVPVVEPRKPRPYDPAKIDWTDPEWSA